MPVSAVQALNAVFLASRANYIGVSDAVLDPQQPPAGLPLKHERDPKDGHQYWDTGMGIFREAIF